MHAIVLGGFYIFSGGTAVVGVLLLCMELLDVLWLSERERESEMHVHAHIVIREASLLYIVPSVFIVVMTSSGEGFLSPWKDSN